MDLSPSFETRRPYSNQDFPRILFNPQFITVVYTVEQLFEALRCKQEGRGFDSRWCYWNFSFT